MTRQQTDTDRRIRFKQFLRNLAAGKSGGEYCDREEMVADAALWLEYHDGMASRSLAATDRAEAAEAELSRLKDEATADPSILYTGLTTDEGVTIVGITLDALTSMQYRQRQGWLRLKEAEARNERLQQQLDSMTGELHRARENEAQVRRSYEWLQNTQRHSDAHLVVRANRTEQAEAEARVARDEAAAWRARYEVLSDEGDRRWRSTAMRAPLDEQVEVQAGGERIVDEDGNEAWLVFVGSHPVDIFPADTPYIRWRPRVVVREG